MSIDDKEYKKIQKLFKKRTDFSYDWNDPYLFWYEGSHAKYYMTVFDGSEPITYRISVHIRIECIEVEAIIYDHSDKGELKVLDNEKNSFNFDVVQENLAPIIGYVQELDIKFEQYLKNYINKYRLKNLENDFKIY